MIKCRRCLLSELDESELYKSIMQKIELMDSSIRADDSIYALRLERCKACDKLTNGMCALCGCFIELRAAGRDSFCPDTHNRWDRYE